MNAASINAASINAALRSSGAAHGLWLSVRVLRRLGFVSLLGLLLACPERSQGQAPAKPKPCAALGQSCEFSPGKLGSCVQIDGCREGNCFVCQSQH